MCRTLDIKESLWNFSRRHSCSDGAPRLDLGPTKKHRGSNDWQHAHQLSQSRKLWGNPRVDKGTASKKNRKGVVHKTPPKVELDAVDGLPARIHHGQNTSQGRTHENNIRSGLCDICAFIHMDADSSLRKSNGIVRAVATENDNRLLAMRGITEESLDVISLVGRRASRAHIVIRNAKLGCQVPNGSVIVTRNHMYRDTTLLQGFNRFRSIRSKFVPKSVDRLQLIIDRKAEHSVALSKHRLDEFMVREIQPTRVTSSKFLAAKGAFNTFTSQALRLRNTRARGSHVLEVGSYSNRNRVSTVFNQAQKKWKFVLIDALVPNNGELSSSQSSCLVKHDVRSLMGDFNSVRGFEDDTPFRRDTAGNHNDHRNSQSNCTWARDDENSDGVGDGLDGSFRSSITTDSHAYCDPDDKRNDGQCHHHRDKLGLVNHRSNSVDGIVTRQTVQPNSHDSRSIDRSSNHHRLGILLHRPGFTREHRLVDLRRPSDNSTIGWDPGVRKNLECIAVLKKPGIDLTFRSTIFVDKDGCCCLNRQDSGEKRRVSNLTNMLAASLQRRVTTRRSKFNWRTPDLLSQVPGSHNLGVKYNSYNLLVHKRHINDTLRPFLIHEFRRLIGDDKIQAGSLVLNSFALEFGRSLQMFHNFFHRAEAKVDIEFSSRSIGAAGIGARALWADRSLFRAARVRTTSLWSLDNILLGWFAARASASGIKGLFDNRNLGFFAARSCTSTRAFALAKAILRDMVLRAGAAAAVRIQRSTKKGASRRLLGALLPVQGMALANFTAGFLAESNESTTDASQGLESGAIAV
ncbi:hypothetical protein HG530_015233 [Fusarium avenaceum]|nr:hypothetical protein HG530_015233 [Fusarium avenaceum]